MIYLQYFWRVPEIEGEHALTVPRKLSYFTRICLSLACCNISCLRISGWRRHLLRKCHWDTWSKQSTSHQLKSTPLPSTPHSLSASRWLRGALCVRWSGSERNSSQVGHVSFTCQHLWWGGILTDQTGLYNWITAVVFISVSWLTSTDAKGEIYRQF